MYLQKLDVSLPRLCNQFKIRSIYTMEKQKVLLTRPDIDVHGIELLKSKYDLTVWSENTPSPRDYILKNIANKSAILCFLTDKIDSELLNAAGPSLKVVSTFSVGYDHIDVHECKKRGIKIGYTPDVLTEATAELTVGLLLCTSRRLIEAQNAAKTGGWKTWSPFWMTGPGLMDSTVGIVGFGRIGQSVAKKLKAFGTSRILYYNRSECKEEALSIGAERTNLDTLLKDSDFVICSCALTQDTEKMFNEEVFRKMKPSAIFVNTSRGGLVDQGALVDALQNGIIRGAGLDVTSPEPLPLESPLFKLNNCVILPHIGSASVEARTAMSKLAVGNIIAALNNEKLPAELIISI